MNIVANHKYDIMYGDGYHEPDLTDEQMREYYHGMCPYTDKPCEDWRCAECNLETKEKK